MSEISLVNSYYKRRSTIIKFSMLLLNITLLYVFLFNELTQQFINSLILIYLLISTISIFFEKENKKPGIYILLNPVRANVYDLFKDREYLGFSKVNRVKNRFEYYYNNENSIKELISMGKLPNILDKKKRYLKFTTFKMTFLFISFIFSVLVQVMGIFLIANKPDEGIMIIFLVMFLFRLGIVYFLDLIMIVYEGKELLVNEKYIALLFYSDIYFHAIYNNAYIILFGIAWFMEDYKNSFSTSIEVDD